MVRSGGEELGSPLPLFEHAGSPPVDLTAVSFISISGAMYSTVPHAVYVRSLSGNFLAKPKSTSCRKPSAPIIKFSGLRSR